MIIDEGAVQALEKDKSLLAAGIIKVEGYFDMGDVINILDKNHQTLGVGLVAYSADETRLVLGCKSVEISDVLGYSRGVALIHKDDLVLT